MHLVYSIVLTVGFLLMLPAFLLGREKYASGLRERLGAYPEFKHDGRKIIWLHCVSVGETNAARPLVDRLIENFPDCRLIISTTTRTGQELAQKIFAEKADAFFYFPFDWKFSVVRALRHFTPSLVLLMETEIWPRFIREAKLGGAKVVIVNGRLSAKSFGRYSKLKAFISRVLADVDLALMQTEHDANRIVSLGMTGGKTHVTGNLKFDLETDASEDATTRSLDQRFEISNLRSETSRPRPLIVAASTHGSEEKILLDAYCSVAAEMKPRPRLLIAPRHPERFGAVAEMIRRFRDDPACEWKRYLFARRSSEPTDDDKTSDIILLDSIGELRAVYPLAEIVFVGGSLIPHGGQSVLEPAAAAKAIITGPHTHNFEAVVRELIANSALIRLPTLREEQFADELFDILDELLKDADTRSRMGSTAARVVNENRGATEKTIGLLAKVAGASPPS